MVLSIQPIVCILAHFFFVLSWSCLHVSFYSSWSQTVSQLRRLHVMSILVCGSSKNCDNCTAHTGTIPSRQTWNFLFVIGSGWIGIDELNTFWGGSTRMFKELRGPLYQRNTATSGEWSETCLVNSCYFWITLVDTCICFHSRDRS